MKVVAISGAGGAIGRRLSKHLFDSTDYILNLSYFDEAEVERTFLTSDRCKIVIGDIEKEDTLKSLLNDADGLIHLAQSVNPAMYSKSWKDSCSQGLMGTFAILDFLRHHNRKLHLIFPSSGGMVYSMDRNDKVPFAEDDKLLSSSPYGIQKIMVENYISLLVNENKNITANILRISNVYGLNLNSARKQGFIDIVAGKIKDQETIEIWGSVDIVRDYVHVDDLNKAMCKALEYQNAVSIFNIGSGHPASLKDIIDMFSNVLGKNVHYKVVKQDFENYSPQWNVLNTSKAEQILGWKAEKDIKEGIANVLKNN